jgi:hypothetical protein
MNYILRFKGIKPCRFECSRCTYNISLYNLIYNDSSVTGFRIKELTYLHILLRITFTDNDNFQDHIFNDTSVFLSVLLTTGIRKCPSGKTSNGINSLVKSGGTQTGQMGNQATNYYDPKDESLILQNPNKLL